MILLILSLLLFSFETFAQVPQAFVYQGQILQNGTTPLEGPSVAFTVKILSPGPEACVLYQEQHFVNMTGTNGVFSLSIGNGVRAGSAYEDISNLFSVFANTAPFTGLSTCITGNSYNPVGTATRKIRITYNDGVTTVTLNQDHHLQSTPFAWYANSLQGLTPANFVQINPVQNLTQSNLESVFGGTNYTSLLSLIAGSSNLYMRKDSTGAHLPTFAATPPGVTSGSIWYDTSAHQMKFYDGAAVQVVGGAGVGTGTVTSVTAGSGLSGGEITTTGTIDVATDGITSTHILDGTVANIDLATGIDATKVTVGTLPLAVVPSDPTKLSLAGGLMSGAIDMAGQQILATGHMTMSPTSTITIGKYTTAQQTTLTGSLGPLNAGAVWYNSDLGTMMYWDGVAAQTITNSATGGGDITDVVAGSGLSGGATTGSATLSVASGGITSTHILDGTIATLDLADASVTDNKIFAVAASKLTGIVNNSNLPIGAATAQLFTIDQVPHCTPVQKLEMSNGPVYSWACVADSDSGGDITEVTTTAPLNGGGTTGALALTLDIDNSSLSVNGSSQLEVKDAGISNAKIVGMTVDKLTSAAGKYLSYMPAGTECANDEILKWDASNDRWLCGVDSNPVTSVFSRTGVVTAQAGDYTATQVTNTGSGNIASITVQAAISELDSEKLAKAGDAMTGNLTLNAQNQIRLADADSSNFVALQAPAIVSSDIVFTLPASAGTSGQILTTDGAGVLSWTSAAVGDITGVAAGLGLTGGGTSGDVSLAVANNGITSAHILDGTVTTVDLADSTVTSAKIVDGTIDTVDINDAAVTSAKIAAVSVAKISSAAGDYFLYKPNDTACAAGQVLKWNSSRWECAVDNDTGDITDVNTTAPLAGGAASGSITLTLNYDNTTIGINGSSQIEVKDSGVTSAKINDGAVTNIKIATVSVDKIVSGATQYFSYMPAGTECVTNEVLKWDALTDRWLCGADNDTNIITSVFSRTGIVTAQAGDYTAAQITNTAAGNIVATTVQLALNELDSEKVAKAGDAMTGNLTMNAQSEVRLADGDSSNYLALRSPAVVATNVTLTLPATAGTSGQTLTTDGLGVLSWTTLAGGDITGVIASSGLSGGGLSGDVTLSVPTGGITTTHILDGTVSTLDIANLAVTDAKITSMSVDKIISGSAKYFTYLPNNVACTNSQVLKWNTASVRWECGTDSNTGLITSVFSRTGVVVSVAGDYTATQITNSAAGNIAATTAQAALNELDVEKVAKAGDSMTGSLTMNAQNQVRLADSDSSNYLALRSPAVVATNVTLTLPATAGTSGQTLTTDGLGVLSWTTGAGGDMTGVIAGSGLSGGGLSGDVTLSVPTGGITTTHILDGTVGTIDLANSSVTDAKIAAVNVAKISNGAGNYFTYSPNNVACTVGQVLKWNAGRWECGVDSNTGLITSVFSRTGVVVSVAGDYTATQITNSAAGNIAATTAQAALNELDVEKVAKAGDSMIGSLTMNAQNQVRLADSDSSNYLALRSPAVVATNVTLTLPATAGTSGQTLTTDGLGILSWTTGAGGDMTGVIAGSGLSGGGLSGDITLSIPTGGITTTHILDGTIATADVANLAVTDAKITSMSVDKIISGAAKYFTYSPNNVACTNGQVLKWNTASVRWECGADNDTGDITAVVAGSGLIGGATAGSATLSVNSGTGAAQFFSNSSVPNCAALQKLQMSAGPIYTLSCVADTVARDIRDTDGDTFIKVEVTANENTIRMNTTGTERLTISPTGFVGIGVAPSTDRLTVSGDVRMGTTGVTGCIKNASGSTIAGTCSSDIRLKKNIKPLSPVSEKLAQLTPKTYQWRADEFPQRQYGNQVEVGLIAQEVDKLFPELTEIDGDGFYRVNFTQLPFYLLQGFSEQYREVSSLKEQVNTLQQENQQLKQRLDAIEQALRIRK